MIFFKTKAMQRLEELEKRMKDLEDDFELVLDKCGLRRATFTETIADTLSESSPFFEKFRKKDAVRKSDERGEGG